jgi:cytidylate kinase
MDFRVDVVSKVKQLDVEHARKLIEHVESRRAQYYNYYTGKRWGAAESYDLCIDASILGLEETEKLIADYIRKRFGL